MPDATVVISVYDKLRELDLVLRALQVQDFPIENIEIIIAEDGQGEETAKFADSWRSTSSLNIIHITQEDKGFRKNRILNEAIRKSQSDYLIFIDGDCIPHPHFLSGHLNSRKNNTVLCGRRVNLTGKMSAELLPESIASLEYSKIKPGDVIFSALNKDKADFNYNAEEGFIIRSEPLRKLLMNKDEHILGCNFSVHKSMLEKINGFDENYEGPGLGEDSDIEYRLRLTGARFESVRNLAVVYHMHHPKTIERSDNMTYFLKVKAGNEYFCKNGLVKV